MTIKDHACLAGGRRLGEAANCPKCRAQLLDAFRTEPRLDTVPKRVGGPNGCPFCDTSSNPDLRGHVRETHPDQFQLWQDARRPVPPPHPSTGLHPHLMLPPGRTVPLDGGHSQPVPLFQDRCPFCYSVYNDLPAHVRRMHASRYDEWASTPPTAGEPHRPPVAHETTSGAQMADDNDRGTWAAFCTCGWKVHGHFTPGTGAAMSLLRAVNHAAQAALQHKDDPTRQHFEGECPS